jgi:serine/threonine protein kinase
VVLTEAKAVRDFLMQCFQKDPNLRVSARKLLKHPWIVNARRSDSVVRTQPTKYDEAVKTVQEWNEALKSPSAGYGSLRRSSTKQTPSSPIPPRREHLPSLVTPAKGSLALAKPKSSAEAFRSPENSGESNRVFDEDLGSRELTRYSG